MSKKKKDKQKELEQKGDEIMYFEDVRAISRIETRYARTCSSYYQDGNKMMIMRLVVELSLCWPKRPRERSQNL